MLALLALLMGVGAYMLPRNQSTLWQSAMQISMQFERASQKAIQTGIPVGVDCHALLSEGDGKNPKDLQVFCSFAGEEARALIVFYPDGSASDVSLEMFGNEKRIQLRIEPLSGRVSFD